VFLLAALTTTRDEKRVRFPANSVQSLTGDEIDLLDRLTVSAGRPHYRDPKNESAVEEGPEVTVEDEFDGQSVVMDKKSVDQLKAYLDHNNVTYDAGAVKADLLKAAKAHEADGGL
jgi:hypothetical protein